MGWDRSLTPQITAHTERLVAESRVAGVVAAEIRFAERLTVEANAQAQAIVLLSHQSISADQLALAKTMLTDLMASSLEPEVFVRVRDLLETLDDGPTDTERQLMREAMALLANLPGRIKSFKDLVELTTRIIGMQRESLGLNRAAADTDGRPTVIVRDFTGRGSVESPYYGKERAT